MVGGWRFAAMRSLASCSVRLQAEFPEAAEPYNRAVCCAAALCPCSSMPSRCRCPSNSWRTTTCTCPYAPLTTTLRCAPTHPGPHPAPVAHDCRRRCPSRSWHTTTCTCPAPSCGGRCCTWASTAQSLPTPPACRRWGELLLGGWGVCGCVSWWWVGGSCMYDVDTGVWACALASRLAHLACMSAPTTASRSGRTLRCLARWRSDSSCAHCPA